jgi:hypothetical protein
MPIKQFFPKNEGILVPTNKLQMFSTNNPLVQGNCNDVTEDDITWDDAEVFTNSFKQFSSDCELGETLSYVLSKTSIDKLLKQDNSLDGVRVYLAYSNKDKTIRAFAIAAKLNPATLEYDDYQIPVQMFGRNASLAMPEIANTRPCPTQCGITNILNRPLP